jgi:hypothetical protein
MVKETKDLETFWNKRARQVLLGQTIVSVNYMSEENAEQMGWYKRPIVFKLSNGTICYLSCDDEGNDGGAMFFTDKNGKHDELPVL